MLRIIRWAATTLLVVVVLGWVAARPGSRGAMLLQQGAAWLHGDPAVTGGFDLVDSQGRRVTDRDFRGRFMLIYFGYSYSPDADPAMLQTISQALDLLDAQAARVAPIFITIDPDRDTSVALGQYTALFDSRIIGLTGTKSQISSAQQAFGVYSKKLTFKGDIAPIFDHSSYVYLMGPNGKLRALFKSDTSAAEMARVVSGSLAQEE